MAKDKKSRLPPNASEKEHQHYNAVLMEEIHSQMSAVIETVQLTKQGLSDKIDTFYKDLKQDIHLTQMAIREHSQEIKTLQQDVKHLDQKIDSVEQRLSEKIDAVAKKVDHHDKDIRVLKTAIA